MKVKEINIEETDYALDSILKEKSEVQSMLTEEENENGAGTYRHVRLKRELGKLEYLEGLILKELRETFE